MDNTPSAELRLAWQHLPTAPQAAAALAQVALALQPQHAEAWLVMGLVAAKTGDTKTALQALTRAAQLAPQSLDVHMALADLLVELLDYKAAARALETCFTLDPHMATRNGVRARAMAMRLKKEIAKRMQA